MLLLCVRRLFDDTVNSYQRLWARSYRLIFHLKGSSYILHPPTIIIFSLPTELHYYCTVHKLVLFYVAKLCGIEIFAIDELFRSDCTNWEKSGFCYVMHIRKWCAYFSVSIKRGGHNPPLKKIMVVKFRAFQLAISPNPYTVFFRHITF